MRIARESRGFTARNPRHWPVLARSFGALFIRSFERGERVHLAMLSRGYTGRIDISAALALQGFLLAFLTTVIASILPAWKASRMNIVDALRHQA